MSRDIAVARVAVAIGAICLAGLFAALTMTRDEPADFTYVSGSEPETLDPALMTGVLEGRLVAAIFEGLTVADPQDLSPKPGIAERWTVSPDGRVYTFSLREAQWSNGEPLTAHDFVYSWRRVLEQETAASYAYQLYYVKNAAAYNEGKLKDFGQVGIRAAGPRELVVTLERRTPFFLSLTSFMTLLPVNRRCVETFGEAWTRPATIVTNGPFLLDDWLLGRRLRLRKNPRYWDAANVRLDTIDALTVENSATGFNIYETGGADLLTTIPLTLVDVLRERPDYHTSTYVHLVETIQWNRLLDRGAEVEYAFLTRRSVGEFWDRAGNVSRGLVGDAQCRLFRIREYVDRVLCEVVGNPDPYWQ